MPKENKSAGGVGESRIFAAADVEPRPVFHVGGQPIPDEIAHMIPYGNTDEGIADREARPGPKSSGIEFTSDETRPGRHAERFKQAAIEGKPWDTGNEMRRLMELHREPGHKMRWLSEAANVMYGTRGYQICKAENGEPVRFGNSVLGTVPAAVAAEMENDFASRGPRPSDAGAAVMEQLRIGSVNAGVPAEFLAKAPSRGLDGLHEQTGGFGDV